jgi:hypothetical protein
VTLTLTPDIPEGETNMTMTDNPDDFLAQSRSYESHPSFKFDTVGATCEGTVCDDPRVVETDDLDGGRSKKLVVDIDTADGTYSLWLPSGRRITSAISDAVHEADAKGLQAGGTLKVQFTGEGEASKPGYNPPKLFRARYTPPATTVPIDLDEF